MTDHISILGTRQDVIENRDYTYDVRNECTAQIIDRWSDKLSVVDIYVDSHCQTAILYYIMH